MSKLDRRITAIFVLFMLFFCLLLFAWVPVKTVLDFRLSETRLSLETSQGRERKQQYEYEQVLADLPRTRAELESVQPLADAASQEVSDLKALRKELRSEKKRLEALLSEALQSREESAHD